MLMVLLCCPCPCPYLSQLLLSSDGHEPDEQCGRYRPHCSAILAVLVAVVVVVILVSCFAPAHFLFSECNLTLVCAGELCHV